MFPPGLGWLIFRRFYLRRCGFAWWRRSSFRSCRVRQKAQMVARRTARVRARDAAFRAVIRRALLRARYREQRLLAFSSGYRFPACLGRFFLMTSLARCVATRRISTGVCRCHNRCGHAEYFGASARVYPDTGRGVLLGRGQYDHEAAGRYRRVPAIGVDVAVRGAAVMDTVGDIPRPGSCS